MKKNILTAALLTTAALSITACGQKKEETTVAETTIEQTEMTETNDVDVTEEDTEDLDAEKVISPNQVIETVAKFKGVDNTRDDGKSLIFENEDLGEFICNVSDITFIDGELQEDTEYKVSHSMVMTMSLPGILPQVYSIREADSEIVDTFATLDVIDENGPLFIAADGTEFLAASPSDMNLKEGEDYIVSHGMEMTKSIPGAYTDVERIVKVETIDDSETDIVESDVIENIDDKNDHTDKEVNDENSQLM